jgi:hypothetical protein
VEQSSKADLLRQAQQRSEGASADPSWGELLELEEDGGSFVGRFRGEALDERFDPPRKIFLFLSEEGEAVYMPGRFRLEQEMEGVAVGDDVGVFRGPNYTTAAGNEGHSYGVASQSNEEPLPEPSLPGEVPF